jgi:lysine 2,3-aminomutase
MKYIPHNHATNCNINKISVLSASLQSVASRYPVLLSDHYLSLIKEEGDAIWKQCMPDFRELDDLDQDPDPLHEEQLSPIPGLIHRYPDRVVLLVSNRCAVYCRFCMRKRMVGSTEAPMTTEQLQHALAYIAAHTSINDVILSGGDPLMLDDESLEQVLTGLRAIPHVSVIRIGTRIPVTLPGRITKKLCSLLKQFHPLYINTHFNHPDEITAESRQACHLLADAGIVLGNQTVLLKGINDSVETMKTLVTGLLAMRIKPYYLHQMDLVRGTGHFRTSVQNGLEIIRGLRGHVSGLAIPHYVIDLPGGKGKVALLPDDVTFDAKELTIRTASGELVTYQDL